MASGAARPADELYVFDGLYGRDPRLGDPMQGVEVIERWLGERLAREPERAGALRVVYIERQTGPFSRAVVKRSDDSCASARITIASISGDSSRR